MVKCVMVARMHPDVVKLVWKFSRPHHQIDYRPFRRNVLGLRPPKEGGADEHGMIFERLVGSEWIRQSGPVPPELEEAAR